MVKNSPRLKHTPGAVYSLLPVLYRAPLAFILVILTLTGYGPAALAHHPHDIINALTVSPAYHEDQTLYIANREHLLKSTNGGYSWKELSNGLDHSQPVSTIIIPPAGQTASSTVFVATLGNGVYRSTDAGESWENTSNGLQNPGIQALSASSENRVLAIDVSGRLYKTKDAGTSWAAVTVADNREITALSSPLPRADPLFLAGDSSGRIFLSADHGASWKETGRLPQQAEITVIAFDPADASGNTFFAGTRGNGLYRTADAGSTFQAVDNSDLSADTVVALAFSPAVGKHHLMVATTWHNAAFLSADGGVSWIHHRAGLTTDKQADSADYRSPHFRQAGIAADGETLFIAGFNGLFKSDNGGHNWRELETLPVSHIKYVGISPTGNDSNSVGITTYGGGVYISDDRGASWTIGNQGIKNPRLMDISFSPAFAQDRTVFSGSVGHLLKSTDSGTTWEASKLKYPRSLRKKIVEKLVRLGMPPSIRDDYLDKPDRLPVYPTVINTSPDYANDGIVFFGTRWHGMFRSENSGRTAHSISDYLDGPVTSLAVSPDFSRDHTVFMYVRGDSIYKSTDGGDAWQRLTSGLPFPATRHAQARQHESNKHFKIVISPGYSSDRALFAAGPAGLFKSTDRGEHWQQLDISALGKVPHILAIGISPDYGNDQTLLISLKGRGLFRSDDGGQHFVETGRSLLEDNHSIEMLAFSSGYPGDRTLYAASDEALFFSTDSGEHWTRTNRPVRYEDRRDVLRFEGNWVSAGNPGFSASTIHASETAGDRAWLDFSGCGVRWVSSLSPEGGLARVYIDNSPVADVDLYSERDEPMALVFTRTGLPCTPHRITVEVAKREGGSPGGSRVSLDAFDILPPD